jgi:uncharacterized membrane protein
VPLLESGSYITEEEAKKKEEIMPTLEKSRRAVREGCALPMAWVALVLLIVMGAVMGLVQLALAFLMVLAAPLVRWFFLAVVRLVYPCREAGFERPQGESHRRVLLVSTRNAEIWC